MPRRALHEVLTVFCGPTDERTLPDDLLRLILTISGHIKFALQAIRFNIFFPPIEYKACLNAVRRKREGKKLLKEGKASRWMAAVKREYRKNKKGGLAAAMNRAKKTYRKQK